ncbi:MAG TPA: selenium-binding protein SBP56-related protein [Vicinamibacterales bacterium]|nr:selenium-binding protein SBP56-related protein [Vicinamibacterales bacterium]
MRGPTLRHTIMQTARGVIAMILLLGVTLVAAHHGAVDRDRTDHDRTDRDRGDRDRNKADRDDTLLVWASDQAHIAADFLAVVDFDRDSRTYGKVLDTVPLIGAGAVGNEPHHVGLSRDGRTLALGGLLSVLRGQDQVFFFDVGDPRNPTFIRSNNPPGASITDEFAPLSNGGFLVTFMGGSNGAAPGRVVEYNDATGFVQSWPTMAPDDGFNPHGISIDEAHNLMVTSDFICPLRTLHVHGGDVAQVRGSVRVWDFAQRAITRTIVVGNPANPAGTMEVQLIPHDRRLRAFTAGMVDGKLYLVDTQEGTATAVFDFDVFSASGVPAMPQLLRMNREGTRLFVTLNGSGEVVMFDIEQPGRPKPLSLVSLGADSGPHYLRLTEDERRLVVTDYFLVEDLAPGGIVNVEGDHKIHVINVSGDHLELDRDFDLDFNRDISTGPARPHGVIMLSARDH